MKNLDSIAEEQQKRKDMAELNLTEKEAEQQGNTQPEENGPRLFTQEEVNQIVRERLARERAKSTLSQDEQEQADLAQRELRLQQREWLIEHGLPADDIADFIYNVDTRSMEAFEQSMDGLLNAVEFIKIYAEKKKNADAAGLTDAVTAKPTLGGLLREIFKLGGRFN